MLKIGYFADGPWSHNAFHKLVVDEDVSIRFICVRFDTTDNTLKQLSEKYNIPYLKHKNVNDASFVESLRDFNCDIFVSMSFNQIFKKAIINLPRLKTINCHAGLLPFYRGRNVLNWALINDEEEFGITVHFVDEGIDTGNIILQRRYSISDTDDYSSLLRRSYVECAAILYDAIRLFVKSDVRPVCQNTIHPVGFYCSQRKPGDETLNWNQTSREVFNIIRSICRPGPQARAFLNGKEVKLNRSQMVENAPTYKGLVGAVLQKDDTGFLVKTSDSFIKVTEFTYDGVIKVGDRFDV